MNRGSLMLTKRVFFYFQLALTAIALASIPPIVRADGNSMPSDSSLRSASELDYPPFALVSPDGSADGFSVDLLKTVAHAVGMRIDFAVGPWHEIKQRLEDGQIDVLPLVSYSLEREQTFDFTVPYLRMHGTIFVRKGEKSIRGEADLKGKEILVMRGDTAHEYATRSNLSDNLILTGSFGEAMQRLSEGQHDAVIIQQVVGHQLIKKLGITNLVDVSAFEVRTLKPVVKPLSGFEQKFCIAVRYGNKDLLARLNEGLSIVIANGTYDQLYNKWFEPILPKAPIPASRIVMYSLTIIGPIVFILAIGGVWYLRREVKRQTLDLRHEIEQRKRAEEALRKVHAELQDHARKLEETNRELESFGYTISHDLRAPLRAINGFARLLADDYGRSLDEEAKRLLEVIETNAVKMGLLIDDLLAFSRVGRSSMTASRIDVKRLVADILETLKTADAVADIDIRVAPLPSAQGDPALIRQVLTNLLENAVKFSGNSPKPKITVGSLEQDGEQIYFVKDNGVGFDMKYSNKLFGIFQRLVTEKEFEGTGVGLAIVHRIITRHGGRVWAEGKIGEGASFYFTLPDRASE